MDRKQQEKQARRRWVRRVRDIKVTAFFGFLIVMGLIGLMWFARPSTSKVEKRDLAKFPTLTWSGFWDGTFFSDVDTWYSDTFPLREMLISMNTKFKNLYGIRSVQLVGDTGGQTADDIPTGDVTIPDANETPEPDNTTPDETGSPGTDPDANRPTAAAPSPPRWRRQAPSISPTTAASASTTSIRTALCATAPMSTT